MAKHASLLHPKKVLEHWPEMSLLSHPIICWWW